MNAQGQKTGGRQKGTPNKVTASMKIMIKAFFINNYDEMQEAFDKAKPHEKLNFWAKMMPYICAKTPPKENYGGEWQPGDDMDTQWFDPIDEEIQRDRLCKQELLHINLSRARRKARLEDLNYIEVHNRLREIRHVDEEERKELFEQECQDFERKYDIDINKPCLQEEREAFPWQTYDPKVWIKKAAEKNFIPEPTTHTNDKAQNPPAVETDCAPVSPSASTTASNDTPEAITSPIKERESPDFRNLEQAASIGSADVPSASSDKDSMSEITRPIPNSSFLIPHCDYNPEDNRVACSEACPPKITTSEEETKQLVKFYKGHLNEIKENLQRRIQENINRIDAKYK